MMQNMVPPQQQHHPPIDEITSPQIFESEYFLQNSEVCSSSNWWYNNGEGGNKAAMAVEDDISASIDFSLSPSFTATHDQLLGEAAVAEGSLYPPHLYNPEQQPGDYLQPPCALADPVISQYLSSGHVNPLDRSWLFLSGVLGSDFWHHEMESQGAAAAAFHCSADDLQTLSSSESQHMVNGSPSRTLASEISSLEDPTFKVGKISAEERKRKIHRYLYKRNQRNFSKKIKYACRKTLADSRPRVRGRFAKNDELGEADLARNSGNNQDDDVDEDVNQMFRNSMPDYHHKTAKEEECIDPSELFAHMSEVNSFKCNYPIQSWI
ncbi:zinc finger protein CONSTANS-LIKE 4-like isoform X1 [Salvia splendens]|uniref:zinc finger protein CONSTANS-LIKE 4-like isoform X1 n=1 Tax=Salvia splendens TaxID=180675 RepID=UPI001C276437|nr:zinc finger protein CONSTANS-LIKE 4-like isoform X1 [Salvia splendens]